MMRRLLLVFVIGGCWRSSPAPSSAPAAPARVASPPACPWFLLKQVRSCADIRGGFSGYVVLDIVEGPKAGEKVVAYYGEGARSGVGAWNLSKTIAFSTSTEEPRISTQWPNSCGPFVLDGGASPAPAPAPPPAPQESGFIQTLEPDQVEAFEDEATARAALARKC